MDALYSVTMNNGKTFYNLTEDEVLPLMDGDNESNWVSVTPQRNRIENHESK